MSCLNEKPKPPELREFREGFASDIMVVFVAIVMAICGVLFLFKCAEWDGKMTAERIRSTQDRYNAWVKYTGNPQGLTLGEWKAADMDWIYPKDWPVAPQEPHAMHGEAEAEP